MSFSWCMEKSYSKLSYILISRKTNVKNGVQIFKSLFAFKYLNCQDLFSNFISLAHYLTQALQVEYGICGFHRV